MIPFSLTDSARRHWTKARLQNVTAGKRLPLHPSLHCTLLHTIGLLQDDASMKSDQVKKFLQINHMLNLVAPVFRGVAKAMPGHTLHLVDAGCGNSYLSLALAFLARETAAGGEGALRDWRDLKFQLRVTGVDTREDVIDRSRARADALGLGDFMDFHCGPLTEAPLPERLHAVLALHACDTATDDAIALGIRKNADIIAVAPCCQAELARHFKTQSTGAGGTATSPLAVIVNSPNLRREAAATFTDGLRLAFIRAMGYEATATEFVDAGHTPKNRLILAERRGRYQLPAWHEFQSLRGALGNPVLALEREAAAEIAARIPAGAE